jgi:DUF1009 family protein
MMRWFSALFGPKRMPQGVQKGHLFSDYLPETFDNQGQVVILSGKGRYPVLLREALVRRGIEPGIVAFEGETSPEFYGTFKDPLRAQIPVGPMVPLLKALQKLNARYVLMAGQISPKRLFQDLKLDFKALRILASLKERNAESLFGTVAYEIEKLGIEVLDARAFLDLDLAEDGFMAGRKLPLTAELLAHSHTVAREVAGLNIGQGIVVHKGTTLGIEGFDGTDALLKRMAQFGAIQKVFFKTIKPQQDWRFDVPVFGLNTLKSMIEGGVQTAVLETGHVLMLDKPEVLACAKKHSITLYGYSPLKEIQITL